MKKPFLPFLLCVAFSCAWGQNAQHADKASTPTGNAQASTPEISDATIVAKINGKDLSAGEVRAMMAQYPPEIRRSFAQNPVRMLNYVLMVQSLAAQARANGLDKKPELMNGLEFTRLNSLAQAELARYRESYHPSSAEEQKFYDEHSDRWMEAKFKAIYVSFQNEPAHAAQALTAEEAAREAALKSAAAQASTDPQKRTEAEAKARAEEIIKQLSGGADFAKLAAEYSDDKASAAKGGDFGTAGKYSPYPEVLKKALFALKPGQVSEAVRQPNGYYILRLEPFSKQPLSEVQSTIAQELARDHFNDWVKSIEARYNIDIVDPQYFAARPSR